MALADYQNQECLCAWVRGLGIGPKQQLQNFITAAKVILQTAQAVWLLTNSDIEDIYKKELAEATLAIYQQATAPIEAALKYLVAQTSPWADCPPVATLAKNVKEVANSVLTPVRELEWEIQQYIEAIEINQSKSVYLNRLISNLDDISDAINEC
jgi:hypothetical protein